MTTGSRVHGTNLPVRTDAGSTFLFTGYGRKTWSGTDYPPSNPHHSQASPPPGGRRTIRAFAGIREVEVDIVNPLPSIRKGSVPRRARTDEHPYTMSDYWYNNSVYLKQSQYGGLYCVPEQDGATPQFNYGWTANHENQLIGRLRERVAGNSFNAGVFLGEGREALNMIGNAANRIYGAWFAFKRGNLQYASRILTRGTDREKVRSRFTASSNWLELQYGWLPLLSDVYSGAEFLAHHLNVPLQHTVRVSARSKGSVSVQNAVAYAGGTYLKQDTWQSVRIKAILKEKNVYQLAGLTDPLSVAWELVPYSFVIDWFLPVGDYLANRGLSSALTGTFVRSQFSHGYASGLKLAPQFSYPGFINPTKAEYKRIDVVRTVSTSLAIPFPSMVPLKEAFSWKRAANAVALLNQLIR